MAEFVVQNPINGQNVTLHDRIAGSNVQVGTFIEYDGTYSLGWFHVFGVITSVNEKDKTFRIKDLETFEETGDDWSITVTKKSSFCRETMRLVEKNKAKKWLEKLAESYASKAEKAREKAVEMESKSAKTLGFLRETQFT